MLESTHESKIMLSRWKHIPYEDDPIPPAFMNKPFFAIIRQNGDVPR